MPIITQISAQKKNNERTSVYVDDKFFCGLAIDDVLKNNLVVGMEVSPEFLSNLLSASGENDMYNKTLVYILRSPRTESEIRRFLSRKKDCSQEFIARIIERLKTMNYINDEAYARMFVGAKHIKISTRAIKQKLKHKGISVELADGATADIGSQDDLAKSVAEKYMRYREYDEKNLQRLFRYLVSKGFDFDITGSIVQEYRTKGEIDPEMRAEFNTYQNEYQKAREELRKARVEAKKSKNKFKSIKKKITEGM
ncbi:MAG: RecX family transcriptional regulator [Christensenellaceae bacterium]|nr:RecX family transcriptional regulator [Christensenellaceae bacterium]